MAKSVLVKERGERETALKRWGRVAAYLKARSDLERLVAFHFGDRTLKWRHYYEIYERHFERFRRRPITLLEIGVANGGSLALWRKYFGPSAKLVGVDIEPDCKQYEGPNTAIAIGSQDDAAFLGRVAAEHGPFDILIDDGSHLYPHQLITFETLFAHVKDDGLYICEDLCTAYWPQRFDGGIGRDDTFIGFLKTRVDELNAWFWREGVETEPDAFARVAHSLHFYAALGIIEKRRVEPPVLVHVGSRRRRNIVGPIAGRPPR